MMSKNFRNRLNTSLFLLFSVILIFNFNFFLVYCLIVMGILSIIEFISLSKKILINKLILILVNSFFLIYVFIFCFLFFAFSNFASFKYLLYIILLGCISSDIGGYIFGKIFKGPKITKISPKKTYAGAFGSVMLTVIIVSFLFYYLKGTFSYKILLMAISISIFCQIGDLLFSLLKRKAKIKDTGSILPGHGGILDRLDGIFLGLPAGILTLFFFN